MPKEAAAVFEELKVKLRNEIVETQFAKESRVEKEFEALLQGRSTHHEFKAKFEACLQDLEECQLTGILNDAARLKRKYLEKIDPIMNTGKNGQIRIGSQEKRKKNQLSTILALVQIMQLLHFMLESQPLILTLMLIPKSTKVLVHILCITRDMKPFT